MNSHDKYIKYYSKNKDKIKAKQKVRYKTDPIYKENHNACARRYFQAHKKKVRIRARKTYQKKKKFINACKRARYRNNPELREHRNAQSRLWYQKNKKRCMKKHMQYQKKLYKRDPSYKLAQVCSIRIKMALKTQGAKRLYSYHDLIGLSWKDLQKYLETKFQPGMKWNHHTHQGKHRFRAFHLDHIVPINSYDLRYGSNQLKAFNYKNIQPLYISDHYEKSNKYLLSLERKYRLCKQTKEQYRKALEKYI